MAKRNRFQEEKRHGSLIEGRAPPEPLKAQVTDLDRKKLGGLVLWTHAYVEHVYAKGNFQGKELYKSPFSTLRWMSDETVSRRLYHPLAVEVFGRRIPYPSGPTLDQIKEHQRQEKGGFKIEVATTERQPDADFDTSETVELDIDADGAIAKGKYRWLGDNFDERPAPDARFNSLSDAHLATVSGRVAVLLEGFREFTLTAMADTPIYGVTNVALSIRPPESLVAIPAYV